MRDYIAYGCSYSVLKIDVNTKKIEILMPYSIDDPKTLLSFLSPFIMFEDTIIKRTDFPKWQITFKMLVNSNACGGGDNEFSTDGRGQVNPPSLTTQLPHLYSEGGSLHVTVDACSKTELEEQKLKEEKRKQVIQQEIRVITAEAENRYANILHNEQVPASFAQTMNTRLNNLFGTTISDTSIERLRSMIFLRKLFKNIEVVYPEQVPAPVMYQCIISFIFAKKLFEKIKTSTDDKDIAARESYALISRIYSSLVRERTPDPPGDIPTTPEALALIERQKIPDVDRHHYKFEPAALP